LTVGDLGEAVAYYQSILGFEPIRDVDPPPGIAFVRAHGITVQLSEGPPREWTEERHRTFDAVFLVERPGRLRSELDDRGAQFMHPDDLGPSWSGFFGVSDKYGNALGFGPVTGPVATVKRAVADPLDELEHRLHEWRRAREEREHVEQFRAFYEALPDKRDIFYVFFSGRLLQWVAKCLRHVPDSVNLVLLGSDLPPEELDWVRRNTDRPFHHVRLRLDDQMAWEFLFAVNRHHFGWIDSDCIVLDERVFADLTALDAGTSMNCAWSWDGGYGFPLANTFLLFVNADVVAAVRDRAPTSPYSYDYRWQNLQVPGRRAYSRRPGRGQLRALRSLVPTGADGRPVPPHGMLYFDTMVMYQLVAHSLGHPIRQARALEGFGHLRGRPVQDESSDELLHVGGVSKADALEPFIGYFHDSGVRILYLVAELLILAEHAPSLPPYYARRLDELTATLDHHGHTPAQARALIEDHLTGVRGMSPHAVRTLLPEPILR
jgi:hypothetical protein